MSEYSPDKWVIVKYQNDNRTDYKVLAEWSGGYLDGDYWRLSSGISGLTDQDNYHIIENHSGSIYKCHKESNTLGMLTSGIFSQMEELVEKEGFTVEIVNVGEIELDEDNS